jgi:transcriptional regulator GlxA family with amidase domain
VTDGKYWTASGVAAGLDMSLGFTSDYFGSLFAQMNYLLFEYTPNLDPRNDSYAIGSPLNKQIRAEFGTYRHRRF